MYRLNIQLIFRLDRDESHRGTLHSFRDRLSISIVILLRLDIRLYKLCWDQPDMMAEADQLPANVVAPTTRFHADEARRRIHEKFQQLRPGEPFLQHDAAMLVHADQMENRLSQINANHFYAHDEKLSCVHE